MFYVPSLSEFPGRTIRAGHQDQTNSYSLSCTSMYRESVVQLYICSALMQPGFL